MNGEKKTALGVSSTGSGAEQAALTGSANSIFKFNMEHRTISSILPTGRMNALTGHEIMLLLGLKDGRDVTALVEKERRKGVPICASCDANRPGYYLPETPEELYIYNRSLKHRIKAVAATLYSLETALITWTGQQRLDLPGGGEMCGET